MTNIRFYQSLIVIFLGFVSCSTTLSPVEEEEASIKTISWLDSKFGFINNAEFNKYEARIMDRMEASLRGARLWSSQRDRANTYSWELYLLNIDQPNAFSLGHGVIVTTRGLVVHLESEAQLAYVISHEMAHQILGHTSEALYESNEENVSPSFHFSLDKELDADELGLEIMRQAKYDPRHALAAFSMAYSADSFNSAKEDPEVVTKWLDARAANLKQLVSRIAPDSLGLENTRDFNKLRIELGKSLERK
ncbi:MAG: M48 family metallopeptidase [Deltaproteobacteria bacterium]|nr:M48 family metallopeptidase [Deltaproteobacteria bacterium]